MPAIRFVFALLSALVASLVLFKVPDMFLWQLKVGATEYGQWFAIVPLLLIFVGRRRSALDSFSVLLAWIAVILFLSSTGRALLYAKTAREKMDAVFPAPEGVHVVPGPISLPKVWSFASPLQVEVHPMEFHEFTTGPLTLDFYPAQNRPSAPCIVLVHGGGWDRGSRKEFDSANLWLANRGIAVAAIDYRLAPASKWPAQADDVRSALAYLKREANGLGIAPNKFFLMGRSAGGQIAEAVAAPGNLPDVLGCIALYAPADMHFAFEHSDKKDILDSPRLLTQLLGGSPKQAKATYDSASAYVLASRKTVPMLLIHGLNDELVWFQQSRRFSERLKQTGVKHVYLELPWATHAFDHNDHGPG
ncbi:MAG TPA: alpha/beta hydrolase, partial [Chthoniobacteraceae bacterium]|nr:alpha/beta hydrolase [Chthoniobacteraceae bacterium]